VKRTSPDLTWASDWASLPESREAFLQLLTSTLNRKIRNTGIKLLLKSQGYWLVQVSQPVSSYPKSGQAVVMVRGIFTFSHDGLSELLTQLKA